MRLPPEIVRAQQLIKARMGQIDTDQSEELGRYRGLEEARGILLDAVIEVSTGQS